MPPGWGMAGRTHPGTGIRARTVWMTHHDKRQALAPGVACHPPGPALASCCTPGPGTRGSCRPRHHLVPSAVAFPHPGGTRCRHWVGQHLPGGVECPPNTRPGLPPPAATVYLRVGAIDRLYALGYPGVPILALESPDPATLLWLLAHLLEAAGLLAAVALAGREIRWYPAMFRYHARHEPPVR